MNQQQSEQDPFGQSYPQSAAQYFWYRVFIVIAAISAVLVAKNNLPFDQVSCIQDATLDVFTPVTQVLIKNVAFGLFLKTLCTLMIDVQFIILVYYWNMYSNSFRLPVTLIIFGVLKVIMTFLFQTKPISGSFNYSSPIPSLLISQKFAHDYFFSGQAGFLLIAALQWSNLQNKLLTYVSYFCCFYVSLMTLFLRQNYSMDVFTGLLTGHLIYILVDKHQKKISKLINRPYKFFVRKIQKTSQLED